MGQDKHILAPFVEQCMPMVLLRCAADKAFISKLAKKCVANAAQSCPTEALALVLVEQCKSKNLSLAEFSNEALKGLVQNAHASFFQKNDVLLSAMCDVIEGKMARMTKHAIPVVLKFKEQLGEKELSDRVYQALKAQAPQEMQDQMCEEGAKELQAKVDRVLAACEPPKKKVSQSTDFRKFMKQSAQ